MGPRGGSGTTSAGQLFATFQLSDLVGVWRPTGASTIDALTLNVDNSYELVEHDGPDGGVSNSTILDSGASVSEECGTETTSSGSFTLSAYGVVLAPRSSSHADSIAIDFYVENTCPIGGPVRLVSEGTAEDVVLVHEE